MIFVTVGTQLPFDRLIKTVDDWCSESDTDVFAQIGPSNNIYHNLKHKPFLDPVEFDNYFSNANLIIAHAGMGSILTALTYGKQLIIMPRKANLGEHRNDHQMATAKRFENKEGVFVAWNEQELSKLLNEPTISNKVTLKRHAEYADSQFISNLIKLLNN